MNIETSRLLLKDYIIDDFNNFWLLKSTDKVWQFSTFMPYQNKSDAYDDFKKMLGSLDENPCQFAALWTKEGNHFIGEAGILSFNQRANRCVVGYNLLPEHWNKGFATEITKALVSYAFNSLSAERIEALAMSSNHASCKVLQKSGFQLEGTLRHFTKINDVYFDVCYYSIVSSDLLNFSSEKTGRMRQHHPEKKLKGVFCMKLFQSHCVFPAPDILKTSTFYQSVLGFLAVAYLDAVEPHICLYRDSTEIILTQAKSSKVFPNRELYGYGYDAYFITDCQQELQDEFISNGANIVRPLQKTDYHNQEFVLEDIDGRWIGFGIKSS